MTFDGDEKYTLGFDLPGQSLVHTPHHLTFSFSGASYALGVEASFP